jgi:hypothetical protein
VVACAYLLPSPDDDVPAGSFELGSLDVIEDVRSGYCGGRVTDAELVMRGTPMIAWAEEELGRIGEALELQLTSERPDGTFRPYVTMWVVRVDDQLYVRSAYGPDNPWFRRAKASGVGRIRAGGLERDVTFAAPAPGVDVDVDAAYQAKYDRYGPEIVGTVVGPQDHDVTIRLLPRSRSS